MCSVLQILAGNNLTSPTGDVAPSVVNLDDIYSAHDFDVKIDLEVPLGE